MIDTSIDRELSKQSNICFMRLTLIQFAILHVARLNLLKNLCFANYLLYTCVY